MMQNAKYHIFIQTNDSQCAGAHLSKYSMERASGGEIAVEIIRVEEVPVFKEFEGKTYYQGSEERTFSLADEQSFTLTRFMPPELMAYEGRAVVVDPDVFAVEDIRPLFEMDMGDAAVACCSRNGTFWDTSVMLLENSALDWKIDSILDTLAHKRMNYNFAMRQLFDLPVKELPRVWNQMDEITPETKMIHFTRQRTQPWKTGLPFTVTRRELGKFLGIIPRAWLPAGREKYPATYQPHPDKRAADFFFGLLADALRDGALDERTLDDEIAAGHIRPDIRQCLQVQ